MATNILKRSKTILTNPIYSKTIYPFVIDKKIKLGKNSSGGTFLEMGRLIRPINEDIYYEADIIFQVLVPNSPIQQTELNIKCVAELFKNGVTSGILKESNLLLPPGNSGIIKNAIVFDNTGDNNQIKITVSAINEVTFTNSAFANYINLAYLEKKEE